MQEDKEKEMTNPFMNIKEKREHIVILLKNIIKTNLKFILKLLLKVFQLKKLLKPVMMQLIMM